MNTNRRRFFFIKKKKVWMEARFIFISVCPNNRNVVLQSVVFDASISGKWCFFHFFSERLHTTSPYYLIVFLDYIVIVVCDYLFNF